MANFLSSTFFVQTGEMGLTLPKTVLLLIMSQYRKTKFFRCFDAFLRKLKKKLHLRTKKWPSQKEAFLWEFFSTNLKRVKSWRNVWYDGNNFFGSSQLNSTITENSCSTKWATYSKIKPFWCFETFLRKLTKILYLRTKTDYLKENLRNTQSEIFLNEFEKG